MSCKPAPASVLWTVFPQASKDYPQLAEHAARMKCQPSTEFGQFLRGVIQRETASNYDNVIATSNWVQEDEEEPAKVYFLAFTLMNCSFRAEIEHMLMVKFF